MSYEAYAAPLFRGATKSAMIFGVPLVPLVAFSTPVIAFTMVGWKLVGYPALVGIVVLLGSFVAMREMSKRDDQYLSMWLLDLKEKGALRFNRRKHDKTYVIPPAPLRGRAFINDTFD